MTSKDWFRKKTWGEADREDFFARLNKAKQKSQYLRIQSAELKQVGLYEPALELIDRLILDHPDSIDIPIGYLIRAGCISSIKGDDEAIEAYELAVKTDREYSNIETKALLDFAFYIVEIQRKDLYQRALSLFDEFGYEKPLMFPIELYRHNGIRAIILNEFGNIDESKRLADAALEQAHQETSGFRYHPRLGLVPDEENWFRRNLEEISTA